MSELVSRERMLGLLACVVCEPHTRLELKQGIVALYDRNAELEAEMDIVRTALHRARDYKGSEAYPCPLCTYINGEFIKFCQIHQDMNDLEAERDRLKACIDTKQKVVDIAREVVRGRKGLSLPELEAAILEMEEAERV